MAKIKNTTVLLTGFDPFGGETINPAYEAVKVVSLNDNKITIIKVEIPTVFGKSLKVLDDALDKYQPDIVICVGQAGGIASIKLEVVAINLNEARIPDNEGHKPSGKAIMPDGENAYFSTLPNKAILKRLHDERIPAVLSYSAGTYVCNHLFYGLMYRIKQEYPHIRGGFIHVPYLPEQVLDKKDTPSLTLAQISRAIEIAINTILHTKDDIVYDSGEIF